MAVGAALHAGGGGGRNNNNNNNDDGGLGASGGVSGGGSGSGVAAVFAEDVVCFLDDPRHLGLVTRVFGESDSEEDFSDDESDEEELQDGEALVCWLGRSEEDIERTNELVVLDRAFLHGDIVARADNALGQTGSVTGVDLRVDLEPTHEDGNARPAAAARRQAVDPVTLGHIRPFRTAHYVVQDRWLGRIEEVMDHVTVQFDDGSKCTVLNATTDRLFPRAEYTVSTDHAQCPYYPGQGVKAGMGNVFRTAKWTVGQWNRRMDATVIRVEPGDIEVRWLAPGPGARALTPDMFDTTTAKVLDFFAHTCWQLGDVAIVEESAPSVAATAAAHGAREDDGGAQAAEEQGYDADEVDDDDRGNSATAASPTMVAQQAPTENHDTTASSAAPASDKRDKDKPPRGASGRRRGGAATAAATARRGSSRRPKYPMDPIAPTARVCLTRTSVDVLWQDGTVSRGVGTRQLIPVTHLGDNDFWPDEYVVHRGEGALDGLGDDSDDDNSGDALKGRIGLVRRIDSGDRVARVQWYNRNVRDTTPFSPAEGIAGEEMASVYELAEHPDFCFRVGDVVLRLNSDTSSGDAETSVESLNWVGEVTAMSDGWINVHWADGTRGKVSPTDVYVIHRDEDAGGGAFSDDGGSYVGSMYTDEEDDDDDDDDRSSWETVDDDDAEERLFRGNAEADDEDEDDEEEEEEEQQREEENVERRGMTLPESEAEGVPTRDRYIARAVELIGRLCSDASQPPRGEQLQEQQQQPAETTQAAEADGEVEEAREAFEKLMEEEREEEGTLGHPRLTFDDVLGGSSNAIFDGSQHNQQSQPERRSAQQRERELRDSLTEMMDNAMGSSQAAGTDYANALEDFIKAGMAYAEAGNEEKNSCIQKFRAALVQLKNAAGAVEGRAGKRRTTKLAEAADAIEAKFIADLDLAVAEGAGRGSATAGTSAAAGATTSTAAAGTSAEAEDAGDATEAAAAAGAPNAACTASYAAYPFARFDSVGAFPDHRYPDAASVPPPTRAVLKRVRQEWTRLGNGLPDTIWVRCSEESQRHLRVAMVGPSQTPYHDGLFLFDVSLAEDFPTAPPLVSYHSFGVRVNPNLYEEGKVCLSLLNTWSGKSSEVWHSDTSTVLQVFVSILGLVLVDKPYYNEAGYERHYGTAEGEKNSKLYNESAFLLSCQTYLHLMRRPPAGFESLIAHHFKHRGHALLRACDLYLGKENAPRQVGTLTDAEVDGTVEAAPPKPDEFSSEGFRILLRKMRTRLAKAFGE